MKIVPKLILGNFTSIGLDCLKVTNTLHSTNSGLVVHLRHFFIEDIESKEICLQ